jgi:hypothetical protein
MVETEKIVNLKDLPLVESKDGKILMVQNADCNCGKKEEKDGNLENPKVEKMLIEIWENRKQSEYGGNIYDFIGHAEAELNPIILHSKNKANVIKAKQVLSKIQDLKKSKDKAKIDGDSLYLTEKPRIQDKKKLKIAENIGQKTQVSTFIEKETKPMKKTEKAKPKKATKGKPKKKTEEIKPKKATKGKPKKKTEAKQKKKTEKAKPKKATKGKPKKKSQKKNKK